MNQKKIIKIVFIVLIVIVVGITSYFLLVNRQIFISLQETPMGLPNGYIELDGTISIGKGACYLSSKDIRLKTPAGIYPEYVSVSLGDTLPNLNCSSKSGSRGSEVKVKGFIYCTDDSCKDKDRSLCQTGGPHCSMRNPKVELVRAPLVIQSGQTSIIPKLKTLYVLTGNSLYETKNPGPAEEGTSMVWSLANEFVYRTGLRNSYKLPAGSVGPTQQVGWYEAEFDSQNGGKAIKIRVDMQNRTLELLE